jgi:hypothetical protein
LYIAGDDLYILGAAWQEIMADENAPASEGSDETAGEKSCPDEILAREIRERTTARW